MFIALGSHGEGTLVRLEAVDAGPVEKVLVGDEYREAAWAGLYQSGKRRVTVGGPYTVRPNRLVSPDALHQGAWGVSVTFNSFSGLVTRLVPFGEGDAVFRALREPVSVLPPGAGPPRGDLHVSVWVNELRALPFAQAFGPITVPEGGRLEFAYGVRNDPDRGPYERAVRGDVRVVVEARLDGGSERLATRRIPVKPEPTADSAWHDVRLDLAHLAGTRVRFVIRLESNHGTGPLESAHVFSRPVVFGRAARAMARPNIILISLDTLRADHLGCYGYSRETSPNIDAFAGESTLFERCLSPSSWTTPAHASVFTGLPPSVHGAGGYLGFRLSEGFATLADTFRDAGYRTAAFTEGVAIGGASGFSQGFDRYSDGEGYQQPQRAAEATFGDAADWLRTYGDGPFFLFVHTYEIHSPYQPPEPFRGRFSSRDRELIRPDADAEASLRVDTVDYYDGEIAYTDHVFGEFVGMLGRRGLLEKTYVVVFSDHGEEFWEHGGVSHGATLYDEQLHVPLIVRAPGSNPVGRRVAGMVTLTDLYATLVGAAGIEAPAPATSVSLLPAIRGEADGGGVSRERVTARLFDIVNKGWAMSTQTGSDKTIVRGMFGDVGQGPEDFEAEVAVDRFWLDRAASGAGSVVVERYDLLADPGETKNLADGAEAPPALGHLREALRAWEAVTPEAAPSERGGLTEREREQLRALGYVE